TDENDPSYQEMGRNLQDQKNSRAKHYMSPTLSAASKTALPRKKILAESNQSFDTHLEKTPTFDSKATPKTSNLANPNDSLFQSTPLSSQGTESHDKEQILKPYDPVTNYLSPRPKFLRYKPNRRRDVILRRENEAKEENGGLSNSACFNFGSNKDDELQSDDEFEEIEEDRGWCLRGLLKFLLVLAILVLCTSYISSMNSPTPSFSVEATDCVNASFHIIQNNVHQFVRSFEDRIHETYAKSLKAEMFSPTRQNEHINHPNSFANSLSLIRLTEEDKIESYQIGAPKVELLGEFEVGVVRSSLKVGRHSVSSEKVYGSKIQSVP
ncbi:hypothetical protein CFOL_v3_19394, partial [Cephalotus follicularis]